MWLLLKMFAPLKSGGHTKFRREKQKKLNDCGKNCCVYGVNCARDVRSLMFFSFRSHAITKTMTITITAIGFHLANSFFFSSRKFITKIYASAITVGER